jgi:hypothetical protein
VFRMFSLNQHDFYNLNPGQSELHKVIGVVVTQEVACGQGDLHAITALIKGAGSTGVSQRLEVAGLPQQGACSRVWWLTLYTGCRHGLQGRAGHLCERHLGECEMGMFTGPAEGG